MLDIRSRPVVLVLAAILAVASLPFLATPVSARGFTQLNLDSNVPGLALHTDSNVVNAWGTAFNGKGTILWVNDNGTGVSTTFDVNGNPLSIVVTIPPPTGKPGPATPTGIVFNPTTDFVISSGGKSAKALFLFATEDGTISGWNPAVESADAVLAVDRSEAGAVYKGLTMALTDSGNFIYAANFHAGVIEKFDADFDLVDSFTSPDIPDGFAPFGIREIGGRLFVTYAKQKLPDKHDDQAGPGNGFVVVFDPETDEGAVFAAHGTLNSPWGLLVAPNGIGKFGGALLVGNFGDGRINAFDPMTGQFEGQFEDRRGKPLTIDGLWGLEKNPVTAEIGPRLIYFAAGPDDESNGLVGTLRIAQAFGRFGKSFGFSRMDRRR
jgi:uncharacterized protein (TIGR03118 family)